MNRLSSRSALFRVAFYAGAVGIIFAVWQIQNRMSSTFIEPLVVTLSSLQERELDALLDMNSLITTLGTGLLGAVGFLLINGRKVDRWSGGKWLALASAACVALSLFFGYVVYLGIISMLQNAIFDLDIPSIYWARQAHFYSFLLAVVLFGDFAFQTLHGEGTNARRSNAVGH
jgi:hypothetical protein